jgi:hypothetical protein
VGGNAGVRCLARVVWWATPARRGRPCVERPGRVARSSKQPQGATVMKATALGRLVIILSIWLEMMAREDLQLEHRAAGMVDG